MGGTDSRYKGDTRFNTTKRLAETNEKMVSGESGPNASAHYYDNIYNN